MHCKAKLSKNKYNTNILSAFFFLYKAYVVLYRFRNKKKTNLVNIKRQACC